MIETPHIKCNKEDISNIVLMPGDPLRAKFIAETYLSDYKLVNSVRNMLAYTGYYKGKKITVFSSGMGMASMGIYCYELYKFFDVKYIIRIGSCGNYSEDLRLFDLILVDKTYTESNYALTLNNEDIHIAEPSKEVNSKIEDTANKMNIKIKTGTTLCSECFDVYMTDKSKCFERMPKDIKVIGAEMEAFALFYNAKVLNKKAATILTVVDDEIHGESADSESREKALTNMIELALNTEI